MRVKEFPDNKKLSITDVDVLISRGFDILKKLEREPSQSFRETDHSCLMLVKELKKSGSLALEHKPNIHEYKTLRTHLEIAHHKAKEIM
jgi:hypothetical protein